MITRTGVRYYVTTTGRWIPHHTPCGGVRRRKMSTVPVVSTTTTTDNNTRYASFQLVVAYDGTRFHGFQRQIDNTAMMTRYRDKKLLAARRPKKRPHYHHVLDTIIGQPDHHNDDDETTIATIRKGCNISVQEVLELVLLDLCHYPPPTTPAAVPPSYWSVSDLTFTFAGRTDKGVHANGQVCRVQLPLPTPNQEIHTTTTTTAQSSSTNSTSFYEYHCWKLRNDMNSRLPMDISVQHVSHLPPDTTFDPRRDVTLKTYTYTVRYRRGGGGGGGGNDDSNHQLQQMIEQSGGPHSIRSASDPYCLWIVPWPMYQDDTILPRLCQQFMGASRDFYYFIHRDDRDNPHRRTFHTIHEMSFDILHTSTECISSPFHSSSLPTTTTSEIVTGRFTFRAPSFRRTMIRNMVGYCMDACRPNMTVPALEFLLTARDASRHNDICHHDMDAPTTVPHHNNDKTSNNVNDQKQELPNTIIINAAPASGLCLEKVTY